MAVCLLGLASNCAHRLLSFGGVSQKIQNDPTLNNSESDFLEQYSSDLYAAWEEAETEDPAEDFLESVDVQDKVVVDVGSGASPYLEQLLNEQGCRKYIGVEPNDFMRTTGEEDAKAAGLDSSRYEMRKGAAQSLPVEDNFADVVMSTYSLNEVGTHNEGGVVFNTRVSMEEIIRVCRPGGTIALLDLSGGQADDWYNLMNAANSARGSMPLNEMADVWLEIFGALVSNGCTILTTGRGFLKYEFHDEADFLNRCRGVVPDVKDNAKVQKAVLDVYAARGHVTPEAAFVIARKNLSHLKESDC